MLRYIFGFTMWCLTSSIIDAQVVFTRPIYDTGVHYIGSEIKVDGVELRNSGAHAIEIDTIKVSCSCVKLESQPMRIEANSTLKIPPFTIGKPNLGEHRIDIVVLCKSPAGTASASLRGWVLPTEGILAQPMVLDFGRVAGNETKVRRLRIVTDKSMADVHIKVSSGFTLQNQELRLDRPLTGAVNQFEYLVEKQMHQRDGGEITIQAGQKQLRVPINLKLQTIDPIVPVDIFINRRTGIDAWARIFIKKGAQVRDAPIGVEVKRIGEHSAVYDEYGIFVQSAGKRGLRQLKLGVYFADELDSHPINVSILE